MRVLLKQIKTTKNCFSCFIAVRITFAETNELINTTLKEECKKERMTSEEAIFLLLNL